MQQSMFQSAIAPSFVKPIPIQHFPADTFPELRPIHWLHSHFAVGGWSPLQRLSGMLTAHMTSIAPHNGFSWHPHRGLEIYTWVLEGVLHHEDDTGGEGDLRRGDLQRMFSGDYIEHQELNQTGETARVIQIWFIADPRHQGLEPHYQQLERHQLPARKVGDATRYNLIGDGSPMDQHMTGRLTATDLESGSTTLESPRPGEDLFLYITDGAGHAVTDQNGDLNVPLAQYDVILARPDAPTTTISAAPGHSLHYLSFYLPSFIDDQPMPRSNVAFLQR